MKKKSILIGLGILLTSATVVSCGGIENVSNHDDGIASSSKEQETKATISFNVDGGTELESITINKGEKITEPTISKEKTQEFSYTFAGWYINSDFSTRFDFNNPINSDITLYAKWDKVVNKYTITWLDEDDSILKEEELDYGTTPSYTPEAKGTQEFSYTFVGWNVTPAKVTGDALYKAVYTKTKNAYTVSWMNGNTLLNEEEYEYGKTPAYKGENPTKESTNQYTYTFAGWTPEVDKVTGNVSYYAKFNENVREYTITFKNGDTVLQSTDVAYGETPFYNGEAPTKESNNTYNYEFDGWNEEIEAVTGEATYTAKFKETYIEYEVKFLDYDNSELSNTKLHYGDAIEAPANPTREATAQYSYTFAGWDNEVASTVTGDVTYKATYNETVNKYTITWKNGDTVLNEEEYEYGLTPSYKGEAPTRAATAQYSYTYAGWNEEITSVAGNKTYTAKFNETVNKYTITFKNGDQVLQSTDVAYGETPAYSGEAPTKASDNTYTYVFDGWNEEVVAVTGAKVYNAKFKETYIEYTVKFLNYDDSELSNVKLHYGASIVAPANPTREATAQYSYTFAGWDNVVASTVTGDVTYKATYNEIKNKYTITWKNGDTVLKEEEYEYGLTPSYTGDVPTKAQTAQYTYTFVGWNEEISTVTGAKTYTAKFSETVNKYTITFKNENTVLQSTEVAYGETPVYNGEVPTKASDNTYTYVFDGWNEEVVAVTGVKTYTAKFKETYIEYTVKFLDYDNSELSNTKLHYGDSIEAPANPTRAATAQYSYTFAGWDNVVASTVTGDVTYKATYNETVNKYTITWKNGDTVLNEEEYEYGLTPSYKGEAPTRAATAQYTYAFVGWNEEIVAVSGAKTYTAKFNETVNKYTITFKNGDQVLQTTDVAYGETPAYSGEAPTKASDNTYTYVFDGWDSEIEAVTGAKTYTAKFKETYIEYTVKFLDYDNTELSNLKLHYGASIVAPANPTREATAQYSYTFAGWDNVVASTVTGDVTYKATYNEIKNKYTITFNSQGGSAVDSVEVEYGNTVSMPTDPTLPGMNFDGWYTEIECINQYNFGLAVTESFTLYANWTETPIQKYSLTFVLNNGEENKTVNVNEGTLAAKPTNPSKASTVSRTYEFDAWCTDEELQNEFDFNTQIYSNTILYARYTESVRQYTVIFKNGDTVLQSTKVDYGATPEYTGVAPTKASTAQYTYTFTGWDNEVIAVTGDVTYNAVFNETVRKYTIIWKDYDGSVIDSAALEYGAMPTHSDPVRTATAQYTYEFAGWDSAIVAVSGAKTYTATYNSILRSYAITWLNDDDTELAVTNVSYGSLPVYPNELPTKASTAQYSYTFIGWDSDISIVIGTKTYKAVFDETVNKYTVTFKNGDTVLQSSNLNYGMTPEYTGVAPTKASTAQYTYSFTGWDKEISTVTANVTYKAVFDETLREYTITWKDYDGSVIDSEVLAYGAMPTHANPTRLNTVQYTYTFDGWTPEVTSVTGAKTYTATYIETLRSYTITWLNEDGSLITSNQIAYGTLPVFGGETPTKASTAQYTYTFDGWTPELSNVTAATSYRAKFKATINKYTVTFKNGDEVLQTGQYNYGQTPSYTGLEPTKTSTSEYTYTFVGWNNIISPVTGDIVYEAVFESDAQSYTITWLNDDDTVIDTTTVYYGELPTHAAPTKAEDAQYTYTFDGWTPNVTAATSAQTYKAVFKATIKSYTVTWLNDDDTIIDTTTVNYGDIPTHEAPTKASTAEWDFTFVGWVPTVSQVTGDQTYKATYTSHRRSYTVTFKNGDIILQTGSVEYGVTPSYTGDTPVKEATAQYTYTFTGWNTNVSEVTGNVTYEAQFESTVRQYTYTFLNEDGTQEYKSITANYGTDIVKPYNPSKASDLLKQYTFIGWFTAATGGVEVTEFGTLEGNVAYYARFEETEKKYTINWVDGSEVLATINNASYDTEYPNGTPEKSGYTFDSWSEAISGSTITRTAIFNENKSEYIVTWLNDDDTLLRQDTVLKDDKASYGTKPTKAGYKFLYWTKDGVEFDLNTNITSNITLKAVYAEIVAIGFGSNYTPWSELVSLAGSSATTDSSGRHILNVEVSSNGFRFLNNGKNRTSSDNSQYNTQGCDIVLTLTKTATLFGNAAWASTTASGYITIKNSSNEVVYTSSQISGSGTSCNFTVEDLPADTYIIHADASVNYNSIHYEVLKEYATVSYVTNVQGVTLPSDRYVVGNSLGDLPQLQRDGYKLEGWYTEPEFVNKVDSTTVVNNNITLYANWLVLAQAESATVTFVSNVSGLSFDSVTIEKGQTITLPEKTVSGYRFDNWYTTNAHTTVFNPSTVITEDTIIYANYIKQWTITFKDKNNNVITTMKVDDDTAFGEVAAISAPFEEGYLFEYWENNGVEFTESMDILSDIVLVAHYKVDDGTSEKIVITRTEGLLESAYVLFDDYDNADGYAIYEVNSSNNTRRLSEKEYYISRTNTGLRADLFGLSAGNHKIMVVPEISGSEVISLGSQTTFSVEEYDRSGYAHFNYTEGVGAYKDDGTMKDNAIVLYVTDQNKNTVELSYAGITVRGIGNILNTVGKECGESGHDGECKMTSSGKTYYGTANTNQDILKKLAEDNIPLIIRFVGTVSESGLYKKGTFDASSAGLIDGLTDYDSVNYGGSVGDNGHMARMKSAKNVTLEGVGSDAIIDGWGFHFMCESASPNLGKSFEVRNLTFINTPEDAVGMEGVQSGSTITASVERCWIHNNEFYCPNITNAAESDKSEGDGSCDFKRGMYFTCSYNYFEGCHKTNLVGSSDSSLQYNLTYHHNYWYLCKARGPLSRQANIHMYNNIFYGQTDFCLNTRANAYIFSESNLFYACKNPYRVDSSGGPIKSYNDSVSSAIYNANSATVVTDKNTAVSSSCAYNGVSYSSFELSNTLFYKDDYYLQSDPTDAKKVIYARCGTLNASLPAIESVSMSDISYVNEVKETTVNNLAVNGSTTTVDKISKAIYAFKITESATATITYTSDTITATGVLCNEAGVALLTASGTVKLTPGTYFIQPFNFGAGDSKTLTQPEFKELKNFTIKLEAYDDSDYQTQLISEFNTLVNALPSPIAYNETCYGKISEAYLKYNQLNAQSKVTVSANYNILNNANNTYKSAGISYVEGLIDQIVTPVTESNANKVYAARAAYNELITKVPSATVSNYSKLTNAESQLESIAVNLFLEKVAALPSTITYTSSCLEKIEAAETAYDALTDNQKKLDDEDANVVLAYQTLVSARNQYNQLEAEANKVDVTFMVDGTVYSTLRITKNTKVSLPANPTKSGYRFDNWYTDSGFNTVFNSSDAISSDTVLYAKFVEQVTVTFLDKDGSTLAIRSVDKNGKLATGNIPTANDLSGYKFSHWSLTENGEEFEFNNTINSNITLYSVYVVSTVESISVRLYGGDLECLYAEFNKLGNYTDYNVYVKRDGDSSYTIVDKQLIRQYSNYYRVDVVGLKAGTYSMKIVPFANNSDVTDSAATISNVTVKEHIRTGFAFVNGEANGAYNSDGTLKSNATVLYVTNSNKDTITFNGAVGIQNIILLLKGNKGYSKPICVRFIGNITDPSVLSKGDLLVDNASAGLTIEGIGTDATINGFGIVIKNSSNVEVRNLGFMNCNSNEGDSVGLQQGNDHVWVHNCDLFYGDAGSDADQVKGDGALDTKTSSYITHSFNHFWDTGKSNLQGMKSESTSNYITYHHNWYDHSDSRHPRIRTCTVHTYNNYFDGNSKYGVGMTMGGSAFVENNYFRSTATMKPMLVSGQGTDAIGAGTFSGETGGVIKAYGNTFDGNASFIPYSENNTSFDAYVASSRNEVVPSTVKALSGGTTYNNFDTNSALMYTYDVESAEDAKNTVIAYAGRVQGGDFNWTFNNSTDDEKYSVDNDLKTALVNYSGKLVKVLGIDSSSQGGETPVVDTSADDVIALIDALPTPANVTLADTAQIYAARSAYQQLSSSNQALVTNYSKLQQCIAKLNELGNDDEENSAAMIHFENSTVNTSGNITVNANVSGYKSLGSVTYNGKEYANAAKVDSNTTISITTLSACTLKIWVQGNKSTSKLYIGDVNQQLTTDVAMYTVSLEANQTYTIKKSSSESYIYLIVIE